MKNILSPFSVLLTMVLIASCSSTERTTAEKSDNMVVKISENPNQSIYVIKGSAYDHPTLVVWVEDMEGNYISTIYITKSFASGKYTYEMIGDSTWANREGPSYQPAALPYWTYKKGLINGKELVPTPEHPFIDAYTGATPKNSFVLENRTTIDLSKYRMLLEINQLGDWNNYWTNDSYPESAAYKRSAQPSLIYSVDIDQSSQEYYLNPMGHGDPRGVSGKLYTNISTITTAKNILQEIKVSFKPSN